MEKTGALSKVEIHAYPTNKFEEKKKITVFVLPINPESYSRTKKVNQDKRAPHGSEGTDARYVNTEPEELKLDFVFDGTNTVQGYPDMYKNKPVKKQLEEFNAAVYDLNGDIHRPNFLKIHWGKYLVFQCILSNLDINFQLFEKSGDPLRAKLSATFLQYFTPKERAARAKLKSPDLTQLKTVQSSDRLDILTNDIYNDTSYLLQVARANALTTIRKLPAQTELRFPPIDKTETV